MEVLGIPLQELIFSIFLPFVLFYVLFYALLRKSKILGDAKNLDMITALVLSAIVISSVYSLNIIQYLTNISVAVAIAAFAALFIYGTLNIAIKKGKEYKTGEAFKTEDEKTFDKAKEHATKRWEEVKKALPKIDPSKLVSLQEQVKVLEKLAPKLKKELIVELPWYPEYKLLMEKLEKGG